MSDFEKLLRLFERRYYGNLIMAFFELIAILTGILFIRKDKTRILFLIYLVFDFFMVVGYYYINLSSSFDAKKLSFFSYLTNTMVAFAELLVYYHFFFKVVRSQVINVLMRLLRVFFIFIVTIFLTVEFDFSMKRDFYVSNIIGVIEFMFLLLPCLAYFYELLKNDSAISLFKRPSFWIVTGIFFYSLISIPYYLLDRFVTSNYHEYLNLLDLAFFYIPFTINFIFLTKAFLCKKTLTI